MVKITFFRYMVVSGDYQQSNLAVTLADDMEGSSCSRNSEGLIYASTIFQLNWIRPRQMLIIM